MNGRTAMAVVYRQSTLQRFDRIIVMDRGHIIDDGTAAELAWPYSLGHRGVRIALVPLKQDCASLALNILVGLVHPSFRSPRRFP